MAAAVFRCPECGAVSYNPNDAAYGYCGRCHDFTAAPQPGVMVVPNRRGRPRPPVPAAAPLTADDGTGCGWCAWRCWRCWWRSG